MFIVWQMSSCCGVSTLLDYLESFILVGINGWTNYIMYLFLQVFLVWRSPACCDTSALAGYIGILCLLEGKNE
ncbi:hypothetical protein XENTR_v10013754 [Xenopus tropicalis]|nr:hypothetical protein XENTR_v10013754 [Xenopus tropicalis]